MNKSSVARLVTVICMVCCSQGFAQESGCFRKNADGLELNTSINFSQYNSFFIGEFHGIRGVPEVELAMIKYLNKNCGVTDVFMEVGFAAAYLYNSYLETGDTAFLLHPMLVNYAKQPNRDFWQGLYEYNQHLEKKITIHGMDFERVEFLKVLRLLMPAEKDKPADIATTLQLIDTSRMEAAPLHAGANAMQRALYEKLRNEVADHRASFAEYYEPDFAVVERILFNKNTYERFDQRNQTMFDNVVAQINEAHIGKFMVICGMNHGNHSDMAQLCQKLERFPKGKLADIAMICKDCYDLQLEPGHRFARYRAPVPYHHDETLIDRIFEQHYQPGCSYTIIPTTEGDDRHLQEFSDYVILMKDQPAF